MTLQASDSQFMARALRLAEKGIYTTTPNPSVGAVIVNNHQVVGEGFTQPAGQDHAEIVALKQAKKLASGATCYVTLEPCCHKGKTAPCVPALIAAGIKRVVYAQEDLNPLVSVQGINQLRAAGITVDGPLMQQQAREINVGFNKRMTAGLPFVRIKMAMSLDGRTAMPDNNSFWISGPSARKEVQHLRAKSCAVISGWRTVKQDEASLTVRPDEFGLDPKLGHCQPLRVLVDAHNNLPLTESFFKKKSDILVANIQKNAVKQHIQHLQLPEQNNHVDLRVLLQTLAQRGCNQVLVEAGAGLSGAFVRLGLVDELLLYMAPKLMGSDARSLFDIPLLQMDESLPWHFKDVRSIGRDICITAVPELE